MHPYMPIYTFSRNERLKSRTLISRLFKEGKSFHKFPIRIVWLEVETLPEDNTAPAQIAVTVPKRSFRKAVDRNRLRRQVREAYRLHKHLLYEKLKQEDKQIVLMLIYTGKEFKPYALIEKSIQKIISQIHF